MKPQFVPLLLAFAVFAVGKLQGQNNELQTFATNHYIHGIPYAEAKAFGAQALPQLFAMLEDPVYEEFKPNLIAIIGMIGDESAVTALINFLETQEGEITPQTFVSLLVVFQSLGHIGQNGNAEAINYLSKWTNPEHWRTANLKYTFQNYNDQQLGEVFGRMAIQGLGITGRPESLSVLEKLYEKVPKINADYNWEWSDNVEEAITLNNLIKSEGAEKLFSRTDDH